MSENPLRKLRVMNGVTMYGMAELLGVSRSRVSRIEHRPLDRMRVDSVRRYVEALGGTLGVEVVFDDDGTRFPIQVDEAD